jgi:hypothetical protein
LTGFASNLILPQDLASSGLAPESLPSNSWNSEGTKITDDADNLEKYGHSLVKKTQYD